MTLLSIANLFNLFTIVLLILSFTSNASVFGYKGEDNKYSLGIKAEIQDVGEIKLVQDGKVIYSGSNFIPLVQFLRCNTGSQLQCKVSQSSEFDPAVNRFPYIKYLEKVNLEQVISWGKNVSFFIKYKAKERRNFHKDIISFDCIKPNDCYLINSLRANRMGGIHLTSILFWPLF